MTTETNGAGQPDAEDTSAVLAHAALEGDKTFLPDPNDKAQAEAEKDGETPGEDAAAAKPTEGEAEQPKPKQTAQERIAELTRLRRDAERDRDFYKEQALRGGSKAPEQPAQVAQPQGDGRPDPADFEGGVYDPLYIDKLTDWKATAAVHAALAERDQRQTITTKLDRFTSKVAELFPEGTPEGLAAFYALPAVNSDLQQLLMESDLGPKVADHLGANPAELARLSGLSPALQGREFAKLDSSLATPAKAPLKTATDAPEPAPQARGSGGQFKVAGDTDDFEAFKRQHMPGS